MKRFIKSGVLYTISGALPSLSAVFLLPLYSRYINPEEYGILSLVQSVAAVLSLSMVLGLDRGAQRQYLDFQKEGEGTIYLRSVVTLICAISAVQLLVLGSVLFFWGKNFTSVDFFPYMVLGLLTSFFGAVAKVPRVIDIVRQNAQRYATLSFLSFFIGTVVTVWLVMYADAGITGILVGQLSGVVVLLLGGVKKDYILFVPKVDVRIWKSALLLSLPLVPATLSGWAMNLSDRMILEQYVPIYDIGLYSAAAKVAGGVLLVGQALSMTYAPVVYRWIQDDELKGRISKSNNVVFVLIASIGVISVFLGDFILDILFHDRYQGVEVYFSPLLVGNLFAVMTGVLNIMQYALKNTKSLMWVTILGGIINIVLNLVLIPMYGVAAAVYSTVFTQMALLLCSYLVVGNANSKIRPKAMIVLVSILVLCLASYLSDSFPFYMKLAVSSVVLASSLYVLTKKMKNEYKA